jgi:hypothetical protein
MNAPHYTTTSHQAEKESLGPTLKFYNHNGVSVCVWVPFYNILMFNIFGPFNPIIIPYTLSSLFLHNGKWITLTSLSLATYSKNPMLISYFFQMGLCCFLEGSTKKFSSTKVSNQHKMFKPKMIFFFFLYIIGKFSIL